MPFIMIREPTIERRPLPIGIQTFSILREEGCYYVDKTPLIRELIRSGRHYFLSRPRRFGKSLLVDTLQELFEGNEPLFRGLDIHEHWDWTVRHPVVRLSFDSSYGDLEHLEDNVLHQLHNIEEDFNLESLPPVRTGPERLQNILRRLHRTTGQRVVVLVDEYDKPVLDVLENPEMARANRDCLKGIYSMIKGSGQYIRLVFVTGITMFSKASFSSGLNNLTDISLSPRYAAICGYTDRDLDTVFAPELGELGRDEIRRWYNGYHWLGEERLYNPHDILHLFSEREFREYWFESGEPGYLYRLMKERRVSPVQLENCEVDAALVSKFEPDMFSSEALLFQSGYLTIRERERRGTRTVYRLDYPNFEVRSSFNLGLAEHLTGRGQAVAAAGEGFVEALGNADFPAFRTWCCCTGAGCSFLNSRWRRTSPGRKRVWTARLHRFGKGAMRRSTGTAGSRSTWSAWCLGERNATCWRSVLRHSDLRLISNLIKSAGELKLAQRCKSERMKNQDTC